jgi:hypothetical protein
VTDDKPSEPATIPNATELRQEGPLVGTTVGSSTYSKCGVISVTCDCDHGKPLFEVTQTFDPPLPAEEYPRVKAHVLIAVTFAVKCPTCGLWVLIDASSNKPGPLLEGSVEVRKARLVEAPL